MMLTALGIVGFLIYCSPHFISTLQSVLDNKFAYVDIYSKDGKIDGLSAKAQGRPYFPKDCKNKNSQCLSMDRKIKLFWKKDFIILHSISDTMIELQLRSAEASENPNAVLLADYKDIKINGVPALKNKHIVTGESSFEFPIKTGEDIYISYMLRRHHPGLGELISLEEQNGKALFTFAILLFLFIYKLIDYISKFNRSRIDIVFLAVFCLLILLPMSHISTQEKSTQENRMLARKPVLFEKNGLNQKFGEQFEEWFNDHFFGRQELLNFYDKVNRVRLQGNHRALIALDGWLFYKGDNGIRNFQNLDLFSAEDLDNITQYLTDIYNWTRKNKVDFYFVICPDKSKIYGEYILPMGKSYPNSASRANQLISHLREHTDIPVIYPYDALHANKENGLLYWKNDTHWNELGGYIGYQEVMKPIQKKHNIPMVQYQTTQMEKHPEGDLTSLLSIDPDDVTEYIVPQITNNATCRKTNVNGDFDMECINKSGKYNLFVYRDSFTGAMIPYLTNTFAKSEFLWHYQINKKELQSIKKADILIFEILERFLPRLKELKFPED